jgi:hypothetical protein
MGIYYDVDHVIRDKQRVQRQVKAQQEQQRKDALKQQKAAQEAHERRERGMLF